MTALYNQCEGYIKNHVLVEGKNHSMQKHTKTNLGKEKHYDKTFPVGCQIEKLGTFNHQTNTMFDLLISRWYSNQFWLNLLFNSITSTGCHFTCSSL